MMDDDNHSQMPPQSDFSLRKRSVPVHPKGFKNEWGALLQHQAEVQSLLEVEQHQKEMQKKQKFREELDKQLNGFREKALELDKEKHSFEQRQILEQNSHVFKQREQLQVMQERESTKRLMSDNLEQLKHRREQEKRQEEEEKQKFNQKIHHDKMYESMAKNYEEQQKQRQKQDLQDWYKDETYRKHQVAQMNREKERYDHHAFINHVDQNHQKAIKEHHDTINKHTQLREYKNAIGYVPVDQRQVQKEHAVESMKRQYEERDAPHIPGIFFNSSFKFEFQFKTGIPVLNLELFFKTGIPDLRNMFQIQNWNSRFKSGTSDLKLVYIRHNYEICFQIFLIKIINKF